MIEARVRKSFASRAESRPFSLDVDLRCEAGTTVLFGPSGSGKTLTLDSIAGFVRPDSGRIELDGQLLFDAGAGVYLPPQARRTGYVFQNYALFPHMTLRRNLEFGAERLPSLERHRRVTEMLDRFHLADVAGRRPHELSGGQKQRCSIARALIGAPRVLLLDEPARGLDAPLLAEFYGVLRQVRADFNTPVLLVTHNLVECFALADEMVVLREGGIVQTGAPAAVAARPANLEVARILALYNLMQVEIRALDPGRNLSRVRYGEFELTGPYFPGKLIGDRVWLFTRPEDLRVVPRDGPPRVNQIAADLLRVVNRPRSTRLEFADEIAVEAVRFAARESAAWYIEFPPEALGVL